MTTQDSNTRSEIIETTHSKVSSPPKRGPMIRWAWVLETPSQERVIRSRSNPGKHRMLLFLQEKNVSSGACSWFRRGQPWWCPSPECSQICLVSLGACLVGVLNSIYEKKWCSKVDRKVDDFLYKLGDATAGDMHGNGGDFVISRGGQWSVGEREEKDD